MMATSCGGDDGGGGSVGDAFGANGSPVDAAELEGYTMTNFMYYVRDLGVEVSGMEKLTDDDKVEEMLDDLVVKGEKVVNITVIRSNAPRPSGLKEEEEAGEEEEEVVEE
ncbi:RNA-dependent RNA polymerase 1 [Hordeum vulgare]|nr:RNA-dependent RNA polymerase 1 [Hordeum vulgare]